MQKCKIKNLGGITIMITKNKRFRGEWSEYLFQDGVEYSMEEVFEKIKKMLGFMENRKMRVDATMWINPNQFSYMYLLSKEEIKTYTEYFKMKQFDNASASKIVECMNAVYHMLYISVEEALDFADYTSQNRMTLTKGMMDKFGVDFNEIKLFLDEVMVKNAEFCISQVIKYGKAFCEDLQALVKEIAQE
jgi:hypothetical protein